MTYTDNWSKLTFAESAEIEEDLRFTLEDGDPVKMVKIMIDSVDQKPAPKVTMLGATLKRKAPRRLRQDSSRRTIVKEPIAISQLLRAPRYADSYLSPAQLGRGTSNSARTSSTPCRCHAEKSILHGVCSGAALLSMFIAVLARPKGFEPPTPRFVVWCPIQLRYRRAAIASTRGRLTSWESHRCKSDGNRFRFAWGESLFGGCSTAP
jgi:hypothetical protein